MLSSLTNVEIPTSSRYPCLSASDNQTTVTGRLFPRSANQLRQNVIHSN